MNKITTFSLTLLMALTTVACGSKKADNASVSAEESAANVSHDKPYADTDRTNNFTATFGGKKYDIVIKRTSASDLPIVTDELGKEFYDNKVSVSITRDGNPFFTEVFTKQTFKDFLASSEMQGTVLLGMSFDSSRSDGYALRLGAQIGQPGIEEGPAFTVEIPLNGGHYGVARDKNQDTTGDDGMLED